MVNLRPARTTKLHPLSREKEPRKKDWVKGRDPGVWRLKGMC